jgi:hypothetical protein
MRGGATIWNTPALDRLHEEGAREHKPTEAAPRNMRRGLGFLAKGTTEPAVAERCRPIFETLGERILRAGAK